MFGDVRHPQPVRFVASELAIDKITRGWGLVLRAASVRARKAFQAGSLHEQLDRAPSDWDLVREREFRVDAARPVGPARRHMDLADHVGEPRMPQRPRRRWTLPPREEPRLGERDTRP